VCESFHGTCRTCHDFRVESAFGSKAEVGASSLPRAARTAAGHGHDRSRRQNGHATLACQGSLSIRRFTNLQNSDIVGSGNLLQRHLPLTFALRTARSEDAPSRLFRLHYGYEAGSVAARAIPLLDGVVGPTRPVATHNSPPAQSPSSFSNTWHRCRQLFLLAPSASFKPAHGAGAVANYREAKDVTVDGFVNHDFSLRDLTVGLPNPSAKTHQCRHAPWQHRKQRLQRRRRR
jgi:hypothetical protein